MLYAMTFKIEVYDHDTMQESVYYSRVSDYLNTEKFVHGANLRKDLPSAVVNLYENFILLYFYLKREGRLGEFDLPDEVLDQDVLDSMAERFVVTTVQAKEGDLPLACTPKK